MLLIGRAETDAIEPIGYVEHPIIHDLKKCLTIMNEKGDIVRAHLEGAIAALSDPEREAAARVFRHLVTSSGAKIAHTARDLADLAEVPQATVGPMLERMCGQNTRILRAVPPAPGQPNEQRYEICHDVLGPAVLEWRTRYTSVCTLTKP